MNPDERNLLERALKLSENNNKILESMQKTARWTRLWGFAQFLIVAVPIAVAYLYLQPYFGLFTRALTQVGTILNSAKY
jgi:hypothetical protein